MTQDSESIHGNSGVGDEALPATCEDDDALPSAMDYGAIPAASQDGAALLSAIDDGALPAASADNESILSEGGAYVVEQQNDDETMPVTSGAYIAERNFGVGDASIASGSHTDGLSHQEVPVLECIRRPTPPGAASTFAADSERDQCLSEYGL